MSGWRVVLFIDDEKDRTDVIPDFVRQEVQHAIRLYEDDLPELKINLSSITPVEEGA